MGFTHVKLIVVLVTHGGYVEWVCVEVEVVLLYITRSLICKMTT